MPMPHTWVMHSRETRKVAISSSVIPASSFTVPLVKPAASSLPLGEKARQWPNSLSNIRIKRRRCSE